MIWGIIKSQFEAKHYWQDAPGNVNFLRNSHRHVFFVELWIEQRHEERDFEYIEQKKILRNDLRNVFEDKEFRSSCENIAQMIKEQYRKNYPDRKIRVFVYEDNENGALVDEND